MPLAAPFNRVAEKSQRPNQRAQQVFDRHQPEKSEMCGGSVQTALLVQRRDDPREQADRRLSRATPVSSLNPLPSLARKTAVLLQGIPSLADRQYMTIAEK